MIFRSGKFFFFFFVSWIATEITGDYSYLNSSKVVGDDCCAFLINVKTSNNNYVPLIYTIFTLANLTFHRMRLRDSSIKLSNVLHKAKVSHLQVLCNALQDTGCVAIKNDSYMKHRAENSPYLFKCCLDCLKLTA